ncbi:MAG: paraslipin [Gammaproteobacteria bacterium]|nr:MAG: protease modulator HflC [Pseudomonadota bacterium]MBC6945231.1 protease modulator HflC [Gammaproteobacteria bacterium]MCE7901124.1 protease modulator HflC [Gammaproteobacteria bacterium PRO9]MDL1880090.1 protease modulator HflC [Gammaproteobacteria bacterium PRO2]MCL4776289.1 protease modulator HflC [Gammaproteobacteria bacterium]
MKKLAPGLLVTAVVAVILGMMSVFAVDERDLAVKFRFGEIVETGFRPGLHFLIPFVNNVEKYPRQILTINNPQEQFLTKEKKNLLVDFFVKWRITDVGEYYRASGGNESLASQRLLEILKDGIRAEFAIRTVPQVVAAERRELLDAMLSAAREDATSLGIEIVDVRVKRIEFSDEVSESVFNRMRQERARTAAELRAQGAEAAEQIRADADRQRTVIIATAYRDAEVLRGEGDAESARIYANAYRKNPEFFAFYRSLSAYRRSLGQPNDLMLLDTKGEFFRFLKQSEGGR